MVPQKQKDFANKVLNDFDIDTRKIEDSRYKQLYYRKNLTHQGAQESLEVAFSYPIKLIVNALGPAPSFMIDAARENNAMVGALVGKKEHAISQIEKGVDILVVSGSEAGGLTSGAPAGRRAGSMGLYAPRGALGAGLGSRAKAPKIDKTPLASAVFLARRSGSLAKGLGAFRGLNLGA